MIIKTNGLCIKDISKAATKSTQQGNSPIINTTLTILLYRNHHATGLEINISYQQEIVEDKYFVKQVIT